MKLIRTIIETFLRPIGGTMLIKSYRYMRLEAGKGSAKIADRNFIKQRWFKSDKVKAFFKGSFNHDSSDILKDFLPTDNVYRIVDNLKNFILDIHRTHALCARIINEKTPVYTNAYNTLTAINNYANNIDVYQIYADMVTKGYSDYDHQRPYHCVYCGRRDGISYSHTHEDIVSRYHFDLVMCERMPDILSGAMGNFTYTARFENMEQVNEFVDFVLG